MADPEVPVQQVDERRIRVLVELRVADGAEPERLASIALTQDAVLARLPGGHAVLVRRYATVPLLALEVDVEALRTLEAMGDLVSRVQRDTTARPQ